MNQEEITSSLTNPEGFMESLKKYVREEKGKEDPIVMMALGVPGVGQPGAIR